MILPGLKFAVLRFIIMSAVVLAQIYLFVRLRRAVNSWQRSPRFKSWAIGTAGLAIVALFGLNDYFMIKPIPWVDPPAVAEFTLFYPPAVWSFGSIFAALLLGLAQLLGLLGRLAARLWRGLLSRKSFRPVNQERRLFLQAGAAGLAAAPIILSGYGAAYASRAYEVRQLTLPFGHPLRVVQLSDIHAGIYMTREDIRRYAEQVAALEPDLFVLTGDYVSNTLKFLPGCVEEMARVKARYGTVAIMGNHERWHGKPSEVLAVFRQHSIAFLLNGHRVIHTEQGAFAVAGIDDLMAGRPNLEAALRGLDPALPVLLLSHRPEIFPQAATWDIPLTLAGHYHGGQIKLRLPGLDLSLAHLRTPYPEGLYRIRDCHLYVNRGIGTTFTPVRLNARPEITLLHLT